MKTPIEIIASKRLLIKDGIEWVPLEQATSAMYEYHGQFEQKEKERTYPVMAIDDIDAEMVKRWYQELVGYGEGFMKTDIYAMARASDLNRNLNWESAPHQTVIMPSEQEIRDEAFETHQEINPDTQQYIWKYAFDDDQADAFITGAKYALSQVKAIDLREELIKFAKECIYVNETPRSFLTVSDIDEYLTQK